MNSKISERSKRIGLKVKLERTKRGLSQEKLAELADLSKGSLGAIERGQSSATIETLKSWLMPLVWNLTNLLIFLNLNYSLQFTGML